MCLEAVVSTRISQDYCIVSVVLEGKRSSHHAVQVQVDFPWITEGYRLRITTVRTITDLRFCYGACLSRSDGHGEFGVVGEDIS